MKKPKSAVTKILLILLSLIVVIGGTAALASYAINNALNEVQREDLLPEKTQDDNSSARADGGGVPLDENDIVSENTVEIDRWSTIGGASASNEDTEEPPQEDAVTNNQGTTESPSLSSTTETQEVTKEKEMFTDGDTYLLMGTDDPQGSSRGRTDSIMLVHVPEGSKKVVLMSLPRDLYVNIPGNPKQKINAAYTIGGAPLTVTTIQNLTNIEIDHVALVDFKGFIDLIDALGGIEIDNPHTGYDPGMERNWEAGKIELNRDDALAYVRWRKGLPNGDIDRAANQRRVMAAIMDKAISGGILSNPSKVSDIIRVVGKNVTVDKNLSNGKVLSQASSLALSGFDSKEDIISLSVPIAKFDRVPRYGSVDVIDNKEFKKMLNSIKDGSIYSNPSPDSEPSSIPSDR